VVSRTTVPVALGKVIVRSAVGSVTVSVVSNSLFVAPSTIIDAPGTRRFLFASSPATPLAAPISTNSTKSPSRATPSVSTSAKYGRSIQ